LTRSEEDDVEPAMHDRTESEEAPRRSDGSTRLSRRNVLALGGAGALGATGAGLGLWRRFDLESHLARHGSAPTSTAGAADGPILVVLTLYGGNDGLNTVVPYQDPAYASARGSLALDPSTVLPLGDGFGFHPAMTGLQKLFEAKSLAIVHGVGYPDQSLSHFESMDIWQSAVTDGDQTSGWIGRWLDATGKGPLRAVCIGPTLPLALVGRRAQGAAVPPPPLRLPGDRAMQSAYAGMEVAAHGEPGLLADVASTGSDLLSVQRTLAPLFSSTGGVASSSGGGSTSLEGANEGSLAIAQGGGGLASSSVLSEQLDLVREMIAAGVTTQVYAVSFGGFDTHTDEANTQSSLLAQLDQAISTFAGQVADSPHGRPVVTLIHTEFGRRVAANASGGTDHGAANVVLVLGSKVKGGFYGHPPSLTKLDDNGNLIFSTDFRSVYAAVLEDVVGVDPKSFLGGSFPTLPIIT
jgi:uncharacterized protein (DUF1501 family)